MEKLHNKKDKTENKDKTDKSDQKPGEISALETVDTDNTVKPAGYEPVDVVSEGITVSTGTNEPAGNNVDVKV